MKKKNCLFLLSFLFPLLSLSCSTSNNEKVLLPYGKLYDSSLKGNDQFHSLTYSEFLSKIEKKENFFLLVRGSSADCVCYGNIRDNLNKYIKNKNLEVHYMSISDFESKDYKGLELVSDYQTISVFKDGSISYQSKIGSEDKIGYDYETLESELNSHLKVGNILKINKNQLDSLYEGEESFVVTFARNSCPDCSYIENNILKDLASSTYKVSYLFDCDIEGVRLFNSATPNKEGNEDEKKAYESWVSFKNEYGLSSLNCPFGYKEGYVPYIAYCLPKLSHSDSVKDAFVYGNETVKEENGSYKIADCYFDGSRNHEFLSDASLLANNNVTKTNFLNDTVSKDEVASNALTHIASASRLNSLLKTFFDFYLEKSE